MKIHITKQGETVEKIATLYGVSKQDLTGINPHINHSSELVPGLKLKIPDSATVPKNESISKFFPSLSEEAKKLKDKAVPIGLKQMPVAHAKDVSVKTTTTQQPTTSSKTDAPTNSGSIYEQQTNVNNQNSVYEQQPLTNAQAQSYQQQQYLNNSAQVNQSVNNGQFIPEDTPTYADEYCQSGNESNQSSETQTQANVTYQQVPYQYQGGYPMYPQQNLCGKCQQCGCSQRSPLVVYPPGYNNYPYGYPPYPPYPGYPNYYGPIIPLPIPLPGGYGYGKGGYYHGPHGPSGGHGHGGGPGVGHGHGGGHR